MSNIFVKKKPQHHWLIDWLIGKRILYFSNGDCNFFIHITSIFLGWLDVRNYVIKQLINHWGMSKQSTGYCSNSLLKQLFELSLQHGGWTRQISWSFWHRRVCCCKSTWDFITFLDCCLGNGHISYRIFLKLAGPYISSQLEPMGKVKWEEKPKTKNISSQLLRWSMVWIIMQPLRKTNFLLASSSASCWAWVFCYFVLLSE